MATQTLTVEPLVLPPDHHANSIEVHRLSLSTSHPQHPATDDSDGQVPLEERVRETRSLFQKVTVPLILSGVNFTTSASLGAVEISLPVITKDLSIPASLAFWPASVTTLATAATLLLAGSVADVFGPRIVELIGAFVIGISMTASGGVKTGNELVGIRAIQGLGYAMHLASSVAIVTMTLDRGRGRNIAFACLGVSQCFGFSFGLVMGGVFVQTSGWRTGWYLWGAMTLFFALTGLWALPHEKKFAMTKMDLLKEARRKIDWVGALIASAFMALLSYLLAILSADIHKIKQAESIVMLSLSVILAPTFVYWVHLQVKRGRPALIPNRLWKNAAFSSICGTIGLSFAVVNSMELFASLFFQQVQHLSALQASIRIIPSLIVGMLLNIAMGFFVDRIPALWIVVCSSVICAGSPLLMALCQPEWPYWANAFVAQLLQPLSVDALFTVGLIVITDVFSEDTQAIAGAVFNTTSQLGGALGLAVMQVVSTLVTKDHQHGGQGEDPEAQALLEGYRASFWTMFGFMLVCAVVGWAGLRKTGRVGLKQE